MLSLYYLKNVWIAYRASVLINPLSRQKRYLIYSPYILSKLTAVI